MSDLDDMIRIKRALAELHGDEADLKQRLGLLAYRRAPRGWIRPNAATSIGDVGGARDMTGVRLPSRGDIHG